MEYYIISKIELGENDDLKYSDIGETSDVNVVNEINEQYDSTLGKFLGENRTKLELGIVNISTFFESITSVNEARTIVENVDDLNLKSITKISEL